MSYPEESNLAAKLTQSKPELSKSGASPLAQATQELTRSIDFLEDVVSQYAEKTRPLRNSVPLPTDPDKGDTKSRSEVVAVISDLTDRINVCVSQLETQMRELEI